MSPNKYKPHVLVLPEDDANSDIANGFLLHDALDQRVIRVLPCAGGWREVRDDFLSAHVSAMRKHEYRHMVILVDFDQSSSRLQEMTKDIPDDVAERVFVVGVWSEPEYLPREKLGSKEDVGKQLASECFDEKRNVWDHELLRHNAAELGRMTTHLRPILFP